MNDRCALVGLSLSIASLAGCGFASKRVEIIVEGSTHNVHRESDRTSVSYGAPLDNNRVEVQLPWRHSMQLTVGQRLVVVVSGFDGHARCRVLVNGVEIKSAHSNGPLVMASCTTFIR